MILCKSLKLYKALFLLFAIGIILNVSVWSLHAEEVKTFKIHNGQSLSVTFPSTHNKSSVASSLVYDTDIVTYKNGFLKAKDCGTTYVLFKFNDDTTYKIRVRVLSCITDISIPQKEISLNKNDKRKILVNIKGNTANEQIIWKSSNKKIVSVDSKGIITGKKNGTAYVSCKSKYSNKSDKIKVTVQNTKYIAFTFDDGPSIYTNELLKTLEKYNSRATFFVLGSRADSYSDVLKKEAAYGHQIGNHSYNHPVLSKLKKKDLKTQLRQTDNKIKKHIGGTPTALRPPYGAYNNQVRKFSKAPIILWSVDTLDWKYKKSSYVKKVILSNASDGDIVLLHDIHKTSVEGFKLAIEELKKKGFELVTVDELFAIKHKSLKDGNIYYYAK